MSLDPAFTALLDQLAASGMPPLAEMTVEQARGFSAATNLEGEGPPVASVEDRQLDVPVRIYRPEVDGRPGVLVYMHGGGWVLGGLDSVDATCRRLCAGAGVIVVSVDYRLAPEARFPGGLDDCWAVTRWVAAHAEELGGDPDRLAIGGDSAGANFAAVVALLARDAGGPQLRHQILVYPVTDLTFSQPSYEENGQGYFLTVESMGWFREHYLGPGGDAKDWRASPLLVDDVAGVAPAHVVTAQYDPLRDEGAAYAARLREAGVPVVHDNYDGMIHGFANMAAVTPVGQEAIERAAQLLREAFG